MKRLAVALILACAACAAERGPSLVDIQRECKAHSRPFVEAWPCVRVGFSYPDAHPDVKAVYLATGDYVAEQVRAGQMTETEAKLAMAEAKQRAVSTIHQRETATTAASAPVDAAVLGSMMSKPTYQAPRALVCTRAGSSVFCN